MTEEKRLEKEKAKQEEAKQSEFCTSTDSFVKSSILNPFAINTDCVREASKIEIASDMSSVATTLDSSGINTEVEISNAFANLAPILTDIMAGDVQALNRPEFACMNFPAILKAIKWLSETDALNDFLRSDLALNAWKLNFKCKPPTMEEFLTPKYIGPTAESLRPFIKDTLINFTDPTKPYRTIALASCIGAGKSTFSVLLQLFISVHYAYMWAPYKYFGLGAATQFTQCLGGWNIKKATELLLEPFMNILEYAPFFHKAKFAQDVLDARESTNLDEEGLLWTTATKTSTLQIQNGVNYKVINGPGAILGQCIISAVLSELTYFTQNGWSDEKVLTFFTKLRKRIQSRIGSNYYARFIIDSQPNSLESPIDKWVWEEAPKSKENFIFKGSRWELFPHEFEEAWEEPRTYWTQPVNVKHDFDVAFPVFKGGNGQIPTVIEVPAQLEMYDQHDILWAPIMQVTDNGPVNFKDMALENPIEFLKDWAGIPSGAADRLFYDTRVVERIFDNDLRNVFGGLDCPASEEPEHLIWNKVRDKFFNKIFDKWYFYYEPDLPRVASIDLAITGDVASISVSHVEKSNDIKDSFGQPAKIYVTDFSIPVVPKNSIINMDAFKFFLLDLVRVGNMRIKHVSFDGFQSRAMMQSLERSGFLVDLLSVDKDNTPYQNMIDYAFHRRWVTGKSIMMKNNLLSLEVHSRKSGSKKIEHKVGDNLYADQFCPINGAYNDKAWELSQVGYYAKDLSDTVAANISLLDKYDNEFFPTHTWQPCAIKPRTQETVVQGRDDVLRKIGLAI